MRRIYLKLIGLSMLFMFNQQVFAYDCEVDGIYYNLDTSNNTASVTYESVLNVSPYSGEIQIPSNIKYNNVTYSVTSIGGNAFYGCSEMTKVEIPNSVTKISSWAFGHCSSLSTIKIPSSVTSIDNMTFFGCSSLISFIVDAGNSVYHDGNGSNCIIETKSHTLIAGCNKTIIPDYVTSIAEDAFFGCRGLTSVKIPDGVTNIGHSAFHGCSGLTSIVIPFGVTQIEYSTFQNCTSLTSVMIPDGITSIGADAFNGCSSLQSVSLPTSVVNIGYMAFMDCTALTSINIPNGLTEIEDWVFKGCSNLASIAIPGGVTSIGGGAFDGCYNLSSITVDKSNSVFNDGNGGNCIIRTNSNSLIKGCNTTVIPNTVTYILSGAFEGCAGLTSIEIPASVTYIGWHAFRNCSSLTSITIPISVTTIEQEAFNGCTALSSIIVDSGNPKYNDGKGYNCIIESESNKLITGCQTTVIPNDVTTIGVAAFLDCSCLSSISIPNSVTTIAYSAFEGCKSLKSITIPNSVTNIEGAVFKGCSCVVICNSEVPPTANSGTFNSGMTAIVPSSAIDAYRNAEGWNVMKIIANASIDVTATAGPSNMTVTGGYGNTDITVKEFGFEGYEPFEDVIELYGLDPDTEYTFTFYVESEEGGRQTQDFTFKTDKLTMTMMDPKTVKFGEVVVAAQTNLDDKETNVGFEWRREDWGDKFRPKTGGGIIYQGTIEGSIRDLNTDKLWLVKPYYLSNTGTYHYGEEIGIDPSDVSYFDPVVHTADNAEVSGNSATVQGYVINGSDQVTSQGMEYWKEEDGQSQSTTVETAGGQVMSTNLTNLDYETTYDYVAFATTTSGQTYYGEVKKFKTGKKTSDNKGDVNSDGNVDISDIVAVINHIAGTNNYNQADVNGDSKVDISDIVAIINEIARK